MTRLKIAILAAAGLAGAGFGAAAAPVTLKLATLAPEGSIWMQAVHDAKTEIEAATDGAVKLKIYPGGIMGSEKDVLFKIKTGQLHGGAFIGYGISKICPDAEALMFPMVFRSDHEADQAVEKMRPYLDAIARTNGFETMAWTEVGFNYAYSTQPISGLEALRATKVWGLDSPMLAELFVAGAIPTIPANVTDVLPALQTGLLETVFGPPTAAIAMQWHTKIRYYNAMRLTYSLGGVFLSSAAWRQVPERHRPVVQAAFERQGRLLAPKVRQSDREALEFMRAQGIVPHDETSAMRAAFEQIAAKALQNTRGSTFSAKAWDLLQEYLKEIRGS